MKYKKITETGEEIIIDEAVVGVKTSEDWASQGFSIYEEPANDQLITTEILENASEIDYQTPEDQPIYPVGDLDTTVPELKMTQPETEAQSLTEEIMQLTGETVGETAFRAEKEEETGYSELLKTQTDLSAQLKGLQAEYKAIPLQMQQMAEGRGMTTGGLRPLTTAKLRETAIKSLGVSALLEASKGNITTAQTLIDRAVAQKYDPIKEEIRVKMANLELILASPAYALADKKRAQEQLDYQNAKLKEEAENEATETAIQDLAVQAAAAGIDALTLDKIKKAGTLVEATQIAQAAGLFKEDKTAERLEFDRKMALEGFVKLKPSQLEGLTENDILRIPTEEGEDIYRVPKGVDDLNEPLSVSEATTLGVAYGTTKRQAMEMGITPARWKGTGTGGGAGISFSATEKKKLEQAGLGEADRQSQLDFLYGEEAGKTTEKDLITQDIQIITGGDGYLDTTKYKQIRDQIKQNSPNLLSWFDQQWKPIEYLNPEDPTAKKYFDEDENEKLLRDFLGE